MWALCIIQRTHAKQCYCISDCHRMTTIAVPLKINIGLRTYMCRSTYTVADSMYAGQNKDGKGQGRLYWTAVACAANGAA